MRVNWDWLIKSKRKSAHGKLIKREALFLAGTIQKAGNLLIGSSVNQADMGL